MSSDNSRGRWVAIVTGAISIAIAVAYLALITVLDARGPLLPPPRRPWGFRLRRLVRMRAGRQLILALPTLQGFHHTADGCLNKAAQGG